jgi:hypothetical protein
MANITLNYIGLTGKRGTITAADTDTFISLINLIRTDEDPTLGVLTNNDYDIALERDTTITDVANGSDPIAVGVGNLGLDNGDTIICIDDKKNLLTTNTKEVRQLRKLRIASVKRLAEGKANYTYDATALPDTYNDNLPGTDDNPNTDGLIQKRPWVSVSAIAAPTSIEESVDGGSISDLQIWYDGADTSTYIPNATDEGGITQWTDKSNFAHNANPDGGATARPSYENTTLQNGYGYLEFDGNDVLSVNPFTQLQSQAGFTVFIVHKGTGGLTATNTDDLKVGVDSATSITYGMNGYANTQSGLTDADQWTYTTLVFNAGNTILRLKGTEVANVTQGAATTNAGNTTFYIGYDGNSNFTGFIAEVILFNKALGSTEYANVENYLKTKWGI